MTADTAEAQAQAQPQGKQKPALPEGIVSPISALNTLKQKRSDLVPQDFKPQQMYGFVKNPGKDDARFPVKHYDAEGNAFDTPQVNEHGITTTRPGVVVAEVEKWWEGKGERDKQRAEARAAKAKAKAEKEAQKAQQAQAGAAQPAAQATIETEADDEGEYVDENEAE